MARTSGELDVPHELMIFPGEGHYFNKPSNKLKKVEAKIAWLDHYVLGTPLPDYLKD